MHVSSISFLESRRDLARMGDRLFGALTPDTPIIVNNCLTNNHYMRKMCAVIFGNLSWQELAGAAEEGTV